MEKRRVVVSLLAVSVVLIGIAAIQFFGKYRASDTMVVAVEEVHTADYPEDPSHRSTYYDQYGDRHLRLVKKDGTHFDFVFESSDPDVATVTFHDVDLALLIPRQPTWTKGDADLEVIAFVDREWNRQQVRWDADSPQITVEGGDGFERNNLLTAELARNCLNAGLWEVMFTTKEHGRKALYYQGWFQFPMGHYKQLFEELNDVSYWKHWHRLEHWFNPQGAHMDLAKLRTVVDERVVAGGTDAEEHLIVAGEQIRKRRTLDAKEVRCWSDFCSKRKGVRFATFRPPGRYSVSHPWSNELERIEKFDRAIVRTVKPPVGDRNLLEIELVFRNGVTDEVNRFIVSGVDVDALPMLSVSEYNKGLYMPMGIAIPPFYQDYSDLQKQPPHERPYFSMLLDSEDRWINHHDVAIDGPVLHRDESNPNRLHLHLLSYERHSLVGHYTIDLDDVR
ncbi:Uncharacterized protein SCG7086_AU_00080 [Chlamydiales bacterium SCGC AG-110-P3]|nr:Uncharacterized protein SCG7086_AU_00080 [Chlamydiales bacterium SCGC AG-110-P3]